MRNRSAHRPGHVNHVACVSLFTEPSEPVPEEPKPVEMPFHHCHRDPLPQPGLTPERLQAQRQLCAACAVCCVFMAGEVVGKSKSGSSNSILPKPVSTQSPGDVPGWRYREMGMAEVGGWMLGTPEMGEGEGQHQREFVAEARAIGPASWC